MGCSSGEMCALAHKAAARTGMALREGVYFYSVGPCYETPAEIRGNKNFGGDAVGMSTVHEVHRCGTAENENGRAVPLLRIWRRESPAAS